MSGFRHFLSVHHAEDPGRAPLWVALLVMVGASLAIWGAMFALGWWIISLAHAAAPPGSDPAFAQWFQSLRNPATGISCCGHGDGHVLTDTEWRIAGNHYEVRIDGQFYPVSPQAVLNRIAESDRAPGGLLDTRKP